MAILSWGKPTIEVSKLVAGELAVNPVWIKLPTPLQDSAKLEVEKGEKKEVKLEGGDVLAVRYEKNNYSFTCEIPGIRNVSGDGVSKPIEDVDGFVADEYAVRLTPEISSALGWQMDRARVSCVEAWDSATGTKFIYTFDGMKPGGNGTICKHFVKA